MLNGKDCVQAVFETIRLLESNWQRTNRLNTMDFDIKHTAGQFLLSMGALGIVLPLSTPVLATKVQPMTDVAFNGVSDPNFADLKEPALIPHQWLCR